MDQAAAIKVTEDLYLTALALNALVALWVYDWLLTLGGEIKYAWHGKKHWPFVLFLANRYLPWMDVIFKTVIRFGSGNLKNLPTRRMGTVHIHNAITFSTQMTIAMRVYAVTGQNKWLCSPLFLLIFAQAVAETISTVSYLRLPDPSLPAEISDPFRVCGRGQWKPGSLSYITISLAFDTSAYLILLIKARRELRPRFLGITDIWGVMLRDGTVYFMVIFCIQLCTLVLPHITTELIQVFPSMSVSFLWSWYGL